MKKVVIGGNIKRDLPEKWDELTRSQLLFIGKEIGKGFDLKRGNARLLLFLLKIRRKTFNKLDDGQIYDLLKVLDFIETPLLTQQLLPFVYVQGWFYSEKLYGPSTHLNNIKFGEFADAEDYCYRYQKSKDVQWLDKLISVLYRPAKSKFQQSALDFNGDVRESFNEFLVDARAKRIAQISSAAKNAILLFYLGSRTAIVKKFPNVFSASSGTPSPFGLQPLIINMAGNKFGDYEQTAQTRLFTILVHLETLAA